MIKQIFCILLLFSSVANAVDYRSLAIQDIEAVHTAIEENHPGPVDKENAYPHFNEWRRVGYKQAKECADLITDERGYRFCFDEYLNGFQEPHLPYFFYLSRIQSYWTGIFVTRDNEGHFWVKHSQKIGKYNVPLPGSELISCDFSKINDILENNILYYYGNKLFSFDRYKFSSYVLLNSGNPFLRPPAFCIFKTNGQQKKYTLDWTAIDSEKIYKIMKKDFIERYGDDKKFGISYFNKNSVWITIPTFVANPENTKEFEKIIKELPNFREKDIIVFDLRGNGGGSSHFVANIAFSLYGQEYIKAQNIPCKNMYDEYRVAPDLLENLRDGWGNIPPDVEEKINSAILNKDDLVRTDKIDFKALRGKTDLNKTRNNPVKAKIFVLTDDRSGSSSLMFLDLFLFLPNTIHVGWQTYGQTQYGNYFADFTAPSGFVRLKIPIAVFRHKGGDNPPNYTYPPKYVYSGNMTDQKKLEKWILNLSLSHKY